MPSWTFEGGNPETSSISNPSVEYTSAGTFDVTMTVSNSAGTVTTVWQDYIVVYNTPIAGFSVDEDTVCINNGNLGTIQFTSASTSESSYYWEFGDGDTSVLQNPAHTYDTTGTFVASLTTSNPGCSTTVLMNVYVETCTGIGQENNNPGIGIFPNPFKNSLNLSHSFKTIYEDAGVFVYDLTGRELFYIPFEQKEGIIEFGESLPTGIYLLRLRNGNLTPEPIKVIKI
ncbi:MAG TPA: PKD domain-containing protein [Flavobacteriales bacterium]|nr:PKD domain-containing protein [Flavobacteriales bacterium]